MTILRIIHIFIKVIEITLELSDLVVMQSKHTKSYIFHKILVKLFSSCQHFNRI